MAVPLTIFMGEYGYVKWRLVVGDYESGTFTVYSSEGGHVVEMTLKEVAEVLGGCIREESRDHAFGDAEVFWFVVADDDPSERMEVAEGYFGGNHQYVSLRASRIVCPDGTTKTWGPQSFKGADAISLRNLGTEGQMSRNDSTGPAEYAEGQTMPGLTKEGVFNEITSTERR